VKMEKDLRTDKGGWCDNSCAGETQRRKKMGLVWG
jgi:hypothetical protein